ncbi:PilZ domain-containing protein [Bdellovibrio sp. SKB1291214]|uniref:flagellar brake protein n=1 Tax=Bdellovibrio sp. SKB1291214 TaxID=1732569 RepID=UPI000B5156A6|nr:PilZ domain-containing protein [Bdellovibrio sp. SKB1291214]UYL09151.1 PilZ domain-containing protein [Bdellovibrio sp. SKB1291214]
MDQEIFKKLSRDDEKIKLFVDLASAQGEVLCKGKTESLVKLKAVHWHSKSMHLECLFNSTEILNNGEEFLGYFFLGGEKYYFEGTATVYSNRCQFSLPTEMFHLQRRQNYRVRIPQSYQAFFDVTEINGSAANIHCKLGDLSSQGCRLVEKLPGTSFKNNDAVKGKLLINKNSPIELEAEVRHVKTEEGYQYIGIEFQKLSAIQENNLFALTMEIHKELFKRQ